MSFTDSFENQLISLLFNNDSIYGIGDLNGIRGSLSAGSFYISLHTASPGEAGNQTTNECSYTGYDRVAVQRTSIGWTVTNSSVSPTSNIDFPICTAGSQTATHFGIGAVALSYGAGNLLFYGALDSSIVISTGVVPRITTSSTITLD